MTENTFAVSKLTPLDVIHQQELPVKSKEPASSIAHARVVTSQENLRFLEDKERCNRKRKKEENTEGKKERERHLKPAKEDPRSRRLTQV